MADLVCILECRFERSPLVRSAPVHCAVGMYFNNGVGSNGLHSYGQVLAHIVTQISCFLLPFAVKFCNACGVSGL